MHPFVIADLAEQIGETSEPSVVLSERALEGHLVEGGILCNLALAAGLATIFPNSRC